MSKIRIIGTFKSYNSFCGLIDKESSKPYTLVGYLFCKPKEVERYKSELWNYKDDVIIVMEKVNGELKPLCFIQVHEDIDYSITGGPNEK